MNPKKSNFAMKEGKLLRNIISVEGIRIDPKRVEAIHKVGFPSNKIEVQSFIGQVNFLRRFNVAFIKNHEVDNQHAQK